MLGVLGSVMGIILLVIVVLLIISCIRIVRQAQAVVI